MEKQQNKQKEGFHNIRKQQRKKKCGKWSKIRKRIRKILIFGKGTGRLPPKCTKKYYKKCITRRNDKKVLHFNGVWNIVKIRKRLSNVSVKNGGLMVSLKTIAEKCGVSTATVSKALNDQKDISEETKSRIRKTAEELGYFPNAAARALKTHRSYNIGVLFEEEAGLGLTHEYFSEVLNGLKVQAEALGYDITFINTCFENRRMSYYEHCRYRNLEGVAIVCADFNDPNVMELMSKNLPVVTIDYVHHNCTAVSSNNIQGMEDLVKYIYEQGHRKIAYIHGQEASYVTKDRLASFYRTADQLGLKIPEEYIRRGVYLETKDAARETRELLKLPDPPTCILYPDDTALIGGRNVIIEMGLKIPRDISVAGYDGTRISQLLHPKLTTIHQNSDLIGREAARRLIGTIEKPKTTLVERVVIEGDLISGQSVGRIIP